MKKIMIGILAVSSLFVMAGCANTMAASIAQPEVSQEIITQEDLTTLAAIEISAAAASTTQITEAAAKEIALKHAGLTESEVTFIKAKLDYDDGRTEYDIEFYVGNKEYDYEIDAYTGEIRSYDYDIESYTAQSAQSSNSSYITVDEAKTIALNKAGLSASEVTFTKAKLDYDDGQTVYEIEFHVGRVEHEFEINAVTGDIMEYDVDYDD